MECGHGGICSECGEAIWRKHGVCQMCRKVMILFLSLGNQVYLLDRLERLKQKHC